MIQAVTALARIATLFGKQMSTVGLKTFAKVAGGSLKATAGAITGSLRKAGTVVFQRGKIVATPKNFRGISIGGHAADPIKKIRFYELGKKVQPSNLDKVISISAGAAGRAYGKAMPAAKVAMKKHTGKALGIAITGGAGYGIYKKATKKR